MSHNAGTRGKLLSHEIALMRCAEHRWYTEAALILAVVTGGVLIFFGYGHIAFAVIVLGAAVVVLIRRWKRIDPIAKMDRNLPKITFDREV